MKRIISLMTVLPFVTTFVILPIVSCGKNRKETEDLITSIDLYPDNDSVAPGESLLIRAVAQPSGKRVSNLVWSVTGNDRVSISTSGQLSVPEDLEVTNPETLVIKAASPINSEVYAEKTIYLIPKPTHDFGGFVYDEILSLDRTHDIVHTRIVKEQGSDYKYKTAENIDLFVFDYKPLPSQFTSLIDFTPIIGSTNRYMSFTLSGDYYSDHAISWIDYDNGSWTETIPRFETNDITKMFDSIIVRFACDPNVSFEINFNIWQNQDSISTGVASFVPDFTDDTHEISYEEPGVYSAYISCPSFKIEGLYTDKYESLYFFRPYHEFTELRFDVTYDRYIPDEIRNMLDIQLSEPELIIREFDHFRMYRIKLTCTFDLSKRIHTADYYYFKNIPLFSIHAVDPYFPKVDACRIDTRIGWI